MLELTYQLLCTVAPAAMSGFQLLYDGAVLVYVVITPFHMNRNPIWGDSQFLFFQYTINHTMDADPPVNVLTLRNTVFNPELADKLNTKHGFHYSDTSNLMQHVLREMDPRTLTKP